MAVANQELLIAIRAVDHAGSVLRSLDGQVAALGNTAQRTATAVQTAGNSFGGFLHNAAAMGAGLIGFNIARDSVTALKGSIVDLNAYLEMTGIAFKTMLGSGEAAASFLGQLEDFARRTPFQFPELVEASKRMMAFGFSAQQILPMLTSVGDAAAALGGGGELVNRITLALGQMQAKGAVQGEEMRQLAEAGIPAWQMLADGIGVDIPTAMKMVEQRAVPAAMMIRIFQEQAGKRWGGMMEAEAHTFTGAMSNITDTLSLSIAAGFRPFFEQLRGGAVDMAGFLMSADFSRFTNGLGQASAGMVRFLGAVGGFAGQVAPVVGATAALLALNAVVGAAHALVAGWVSAVARIPLAAAGIVAGLNPVTVVIATIIALLLAIPALLDRIGSMSYAEYTAAAENPMIEGSWANPKLSEEAFNAQKSQAADWAKEYKEMMTAPFKAVWEAIEMPGAAQAADAVQEAVSGVGQAATSATSSVDGLRDSLQAARDAAGGTREALSAARDELQRFANAALPGEWALQDRMGELDEQIAGIKEGQAQKRLDRLMRRPLRTPAQQLKALELQREIAGYQMVPYQNQHDQLRRLASDQITLSFEEAAAGVRASKSKVEALEAELKAREANIRAMEEALRLAEKQTKEAAALPKSLEQVIGPTTPLRFATDSLAALNRDSYLAKPTPSLADINRDSYVLPAPVVAQAPAYAGGTATPQPGGAATLNVNVTVSGVGQELAQEIGRQVKQAAGQLVVGVSTTGNTASKDIPGAY